MNDRTMQIADKIISIAGVTNVLMDPEDMLDYTCDESPVKPSAPDIVVLPESTKQCSHIVKACYELGVPVVPRGQGTGLTGGAVPTHGGVVISTERMRTVTDVDTKNMTVTTQPGVITADLHTAVEQRGLFYPPDPASFESCSIGGNVAVNAGGPKTLKYGVTRNYLTAIEAVMPGGNVISYGSKAIKNTTGYDLCQLLCGSEGTLGLITSATFRLLPLPATTIDLLITFDALEKAAGAVTDILTEKRLLPSVVEFMDCASVLCAEHGLQKKLPFTPADAHLLIQVDGNNDNDVELQAEQIADACMRLGAIDVLAAVTKPDRERLWQVRRIVLEAAKAKGSRAELQDVSVPRSLIPELLIETQRICDEAKIPLACVGHAGDGNVHFIIYDEGIDHDHWDRSVSGVLQKIMMLVLKLGGTIAGEHGIGSYKRSLLTHALGKTERFIMESVKRSIDPELLMNPGKAI